MKLKRTQGSTYFCRVKRSTKIFNDPVYGFIEVPHGLLLALVDHPWFQRLRRIRQTGMVQLVYPGALHTRFHHALGALHLTRQAIEVLRQKGATITDEEAEGVSAAILLHDIGHGPYSHALENTIVNLHHEELSLQFMQALNREFGGALNLAIEIFTDIYPKKFLHQLISSQLDMDRMDYLNRDSFYTGVSEGVIGYDRIIKMLRVHEGQLVVEEKGIYSVEKFLLARRLMYWQVYLHKTSVVAENMLNHLLARAKELLLEGQNLYAPPALEWFFTRLKQMPGDPDEVLEAFSRLDDNDLNVAIKEWTFHPDKLLSLLANGLHNRSLFRLVWVKDADVSVMRQQLLSKLSVQYTTFAHSKQLVLEGSISHTAYSPKKEQIIILFKNGKSVPIEQCSELALHTNTVEKKYICFPKDVNITFF